MAQNRSRARPIWTVDSETDPFKAGRIPAPFIWGVYTGESYHEFETTEEIVLFLYDKDVIVYAHNGGKFDWHFLLNYVPDGERITIIAGRLAKFKIGNCEFRDSYNIIPAPLSQYQKDEIDYAIFEAGERDKPENKKAISDYLKSDCVYLHEIVTDFIENYGINLTQASAAMKFWSKQSGIKKPNSGPNYYDRMKPFYYGGRVQCFESGIINDKFSVIDINSAYPFAMVHNHAWGGEYESYDNLDGFSKEQTERAFICLTAESLGAFPYRGDDGSLSFPNDKQLRKFNVTGWEYLAAIETETLKRPEIHFVYSFLDKINFTEYVEHFFNIKDQAKQSGDKAQYLFAKIFLNALYGKFASNPEKYEEFMVIPNDELAEHCENNEWFYCRTINQDSSIVNRPISDDIKRYYDISVSSSITGFVRAYLWRSICQCGGVMYCDTDCIVARSIGPELDIDPQRLGAWDIEANCVEGAIAGKKLYAFKKDNGDYKIASKGVRLRPDQIISVAKGVTLTYSPEVPTFSAKRAITFTPRKIKWTK